MIVDEMIVYEVIVDEMNATQKKNVWKTSSKMSGYIQKLFRNCPEIAVFMTIVGIQNFLNILKYPKNIQNDFFKLKNVLYINEMFRILISRKCLGYVYK